MKVATSLVFGLVMLAFVGVGVQAQDKDKKVEPKSVTLKGTITCTKCALGETADCGHAIKVKEGNKDVYYYFVDKGGAEKYHAKVCTADAAGSVLGVVGEKDKKKTITPAKDGVKFN